MKKVLLSLSKKGVERLHKLAKLNSENEGSISETVELALLLLEKEFDHDVAWKKLKVFANKDINLGIGKFNRNDAYTGKRFD